MSTNQLPTHKGLTWKDMPGSDDTCRRMNFSLFKRGQISLEYVKLGQRQRAVTNMVGRRVAR